MANTLWVENHENVIPNVVFYHIVLDVQKPANNKGADQPAYPRNLISTLVIRYLKGNVIKHLFLALDSLLNLNSPILLGGIQHCKVSGYTPAQADLNLCCITHKSTCT